MRKLTLALLATAITTLATPAGGAEYVLKFAGLAPEGTSYMAITHRWIDAIRERSNGRLKIIFYTGGVMGDEPDLVRKIKLGQLHGAGLTGLGTGSAVPAVRVLEQPFLFRNLSEVDAVRAKLDPRFGELFRAAGYELLAWTEVGFIELYSTEPLRTFDDAKGRRMWIWQADPVAVAIGKAMPEMAGIPLSVPELIASANAGGIDVMYSSPLALVAAGLQTKMRHVIDLPLAYGTGAVLMDRRALLALPDDLQKVLLDASREFLPEMIPETRRQNSDAAKVMREMGLTAHAPDPALVEAIGSRLRPVRDGFVGTAYDRALLDEVVGAIESVRSGAAKP